MSRFVGLTVTSRDRHRALTELMKINPDEITSTLRQRIAGLGEGEADLTEVR